MLSVLRQRTSFPAYDSTTILEMKWELLKFRGWQPTDATPALELFHFHNKLVDDNMKEVLDPYPGKHMLNLQALVNALSKFLKALFRP